ncbi:MAG: GAF domain-containing protein, partial [Planctomycetales bacterium]|nr:GAF domain-containing protein [Planctomycetales bacterium]
MNDTVLRFGAADLTNCDREPIHIPGCIQPHGCLMAFDTDTLRLTHWSANVESHLGITPVGGSSLDELGVHFETDVCDTILRGREGTVHPVRLLFREAGLEERRRPAVAHHYQGRLIIECENLPSDAAGVPWLNRLPLRLAATGQKLQACQDLESLYSEIAAEVRNLNGFDRVMVYRFLEEGHGAVVGESVADGFGSFLGLHYPATDIPQQARRLYTISAVRAIADIAAEPIAMLATSDEPLDLSFSCFRAVSPIHVE